MQLVRLETVKQNNKSLLDNILLDMKKSCLSELRYCNDSCRQQMAKLITERYPTESASLYEWNDAIQYLTGGTGENTEDKARKKLIHFLRSVK